MLLFFTPFNEREQFCTPREGNPGNVLQTSKNLPKYFYQCECLTVLIYIHTVVGLLMYRNEVLVVHTTYCTALNYWSKRSSHVTTSYRMKETFKNNYYKFNSPVHVLDKWWRYKILSEKLMKPSLFQTLLSWHYIGQDTQWCV